MPSKRRRKRRQPQHGDCESRPKRQAPQHIILQHVTLHEHLNLTLPGNLSTYLQSDVPRRPRKGVRLSACSLAVLKTSFCIGRLFLTPVNGADLGALLSQIRATEKSITTNVLLDPYKSDYIEFCDIRGSVYVPVNVIPHWFVRVLNIHGGRYNVLFVLHNSEREEGKEVNLPTLSSGLEQGMENTSTERGNGVGRREGCGVEGVGSEGMKRRNGCVELELWVGGAMCEPGDPNAQPSGSNLGEMVTMFNPQVSLGMRSHHLSCNGQYIASSCVFSSFHTIIVHFSPFILLRVGQRLRISTLPGKVGHTSCDVT